MAPRSELRGAIDAMRPTRPQPFIPDDFANGHSKGNKAVQVTVTVFNSGTERISVETGLPSVNDADGASQSW